MLDDTLQTREKRFFSWLARYIIQVILIIQERTSENILFRKRRPSILKQEKSFKGLEKSEKIGYNMSNHLS